ncbi:UNVERIFIED_CONTAM: hypothetical protein K2H54_024368 [Gekko kuhli]
MMAAVHSPDYYRGRAEIQGRFTATREREHRLCGTWGSPNSRRPSAQGPPPLVVASRERCQDKENGKRSGTAHDMPGESTHPAGSLCSRCSPTTGEGVWTRLAGTDNRERTNTTEASKGNGGGRGALSGI